jgi:hypothetical protein
VDTARVVDLADLDREAQPRVRGRERLPARKRTREGFARLRERDPQGTVDALRDEPGAAAGESLDGGDPARVGGLVRLGLGLEEHERDRAERHGRRRDLGGRRGTGQDGGRRGRRGGLELDLPDELPRLERRDPPELALEVALQVGVEAERGERLARGGETAHEVARGPLAEGIDGCRPP